MGLVTKTCGYLTEITPSDRSMFFHIYASPNGVDITEAACEGEVAVATLLEAIKLANEIYEGFKHDRS